ncbi:MAG: MFS transporter [bacterium]|nr:MFS transporter [bacterium]
MTAAEPSTQPTPKGTWAWILYDPANTVYPATLTFLFTPWIAKTWEGGATTIGIVNFASMVIAALLVPALGALTDHTTRTHRYLAYATLACVAALAAWGLDYGFGWLMVWFFVANLTYNLGILFYNALLSSVALDERAGRVSARAVGVGYFATILILFTLLPLKIPATQKFPVAAGLFLFFALPCLMFVRDNRPARAGNAGQAMRAALTSLGTTLRELPQHPALLWFLVANFCFVDVLNTAVFFFSDLTQTTFQSQAAAGEVALFGLDYSGDGGLDLLVMVMAVTLNTLALVFGLLIGPWTDRAPLAVIATSGIALLGALLGGALFAGESAIGYLLTLVVLGAFGLTGMWSAGRKVILLLAPREQVGQYFGLYGITLKLSVLGGVIYGLVRDNFDSKAALLSQSPQLILGLICLAMVRLPRRPGDADGPAPDAPAEAVAR